MQIFLDTANLEEIKKYTDWGVIDGITTNPSLVAKEGGVNFEKRIKEIAKLIDGPISAEVLSVDAKGMINEGRIYHKWHKNIYVKLPTTVEGIKALNVLTKEGIKVNMTLVFSAGQALLVAKAGAKLVSPFIGRLDDIAEDGLGLIDEISQIYSNYDFDTKILVASVRNPRHVIESAKMGADICTIPIDVLEKLLSHPLTEIGLNKFIADSKKNK